MKTHTAIKVTYVYENKENGKLLRVIVEKIVIDNHYNILETLKTITIFSPLHLCECDLHFFTHSGIETLQQIVSNLNSTSQNT